MMENKEKRRLGQSCHFRQGVRPVIEIVSSTIITPAISCRNLFSFSRKINILGSKNVHFPRNFFKKNSTILQFIILFNLIIWPISQLTLKNWITSFLLGGDSNPRDLKFKFQNEEGIKAREGREGF